MKIFEKKEYIDGGPNDRGVILGYEKGESPEQLKKKYGINHGFIQFREISLEDFKERKKVAWVNYAMYKI